MVKLKIKHFDHDNLADKKVFEDKFTWDKDITIEAILFKRKDGVALTASDVTIRLAGVPLTVDHAQCNTFGTDRLNYWPIKQELKAHQTLEYSGVNYEGAIIDLVVEIVFEEKG